MGPGCCRKKKGLEEYGQHQTGAEVRIRCRGCISGRVLHFERGSQKHIGKALQRAPSRQLAGKQRFLCSP